MTRTRFSAWKAAIVPAGLLTVGIGALAALMLTPGSQAVMAHLSSALTSADKALDEVMAVPLTRIALTGTDNLDAAVVEEVIGLSPGDDLMRVNLPALATRLRDLAWVSDVDLRRDASGVLTVALTERVPMALWQRSGKVVLIDAEGAVLSREVQARWLDLPLLVGDGAPKAADDLFEVLATAPELKDRVRAAIRISGRRWDLVFDSGTRLRLPADDGAGSVKRTWERFAGLESRHDLLGRQLAVLDMRLADRLVVRMQNGAEDPQVKGAGFLSVSNSF